MAQVHAEVDKRRHAPATSNGVAHRPITPLFYRIDERRFASADNLLAIADDRSQPRASWPPRANRIPRPLRRAGLKFLAYLFRDQRNVNNAVIASGREMLTLQLEGTETLRDLVARVRDLTVAVDAGSHAVSAAEERIEKIEFEMGATSRAIAQMSESFAAASEEHRARIEALMARMEAFETARAADSVRTIEEIDETRRAAAAIAESVASLESLRMGDLEPHIRSVSELLAGHAERLAPLEESLGQLAMARAMEAEILSDVRAEVSRLEAADSERLARELEAAASVEDLRASLAMVEARLHRRELVVSNNQSSLEARLTAAEIAAKSAVSATDAADLVERLAVLEEALDAGVAGLHEEMTSIAASTVRRSDLAGLQPALAAIRQMLEVIPVHEAAIERLEAQFNERTDAVVARIDEIVAGVASDRVSSVDVSDLRAHVEARFAEATDAIERLDAIGVRTRDEAALREEAARDYVDTRLGEIVARVESARETAANEIEPVLESLRHSIAAGDANVDALALSLNVRVGELVERISVEREAAKAELEPTLAEIRESVDAGRNELNLTIESRLAEIREKAGSADLQELVSKVDAQGMELRELVASSEMLETVGKRLSAAIAQNSDDLRAIEAERGEPSAELESLRAEVRSALAGIEASALKRSDLEEAQLTLAGLREITVHVGTHGRLLRRLVESSDLIGPLAARVDELSAVGGTLEAGLAALRSEIARGPFSGEQQVELSAIVEALRLQVSEVSRRLVAAEANEQRIATMDVRLATNDQRLAQLEPKIAMNAERLTQLGMKNEIVAAGLGQVAPRLEEQEATIARLVESVISSGGGDVDDAMLVKVADTFRGSEESVTERLRQYLPRLEQLQLTRNSTIVDLGAGRGEWLRLLADRGLVPTGVDSNIVLVDRLREQGLNATHRDALEFMKQMHDNSVSLITAHHIVEHVSFGYLERLIREISRALRPGGMVIFETPNPANVLTASCNFYLDPTHRHPIPSPLLRLQCENHGLVDIDVLELHPDAEARVPGESLLVDRFNSFFYGAMDYAIVARAV